MVKMMSLQMPNKALHQGHILVRQGRTRLPSVCVRAIAAAPKAPAAGGALSRAQWQNLPLKHVVESQQFSKEALDVIFETAIEMEKIKPGSPESKQLEGLIMSTLFYEPSTRTRLSFESAMCRLGGSVLSTESAGEYSSAAKGETLEGGWILYLRIKLCLMQYFGVLMCFFVYHQTLFGPLRGTRIASSCVTSKRDLQRRLQLRHQSQSSMLEMALDSIPLRYWIGCILNVYNTLA